MVVPMTQDRPPNDNAPPRVNPVTLAAQKPDTLLRRVMAAHPKLTEAKARGRSRLEPRIFGRQFHSSIERPHRLACRLFGRTIAFR
jgi:hypothetical protein